MSSQTVLQPGAVLNAQLPLQGLQFQAVLYPSIFCPQTCITVCPSFFEENLTPRLHLVDQVPLREAGKEYLNSTDTLYHEHPSAYTAQVWQEHIHAQKVIYLPHTGQLFTRPDVIQAAALIIHLLQEEDLLALSQPEPAA